MYNTVNKQQGEKRMRVRSLLAAAAALAIGASTASAAFTIVDTRTAGTGQYAGFDVVRFFAKMGAADAGTGLQSVNATLTSPENFRFGTRNLDDLPDDGSGSFQANDVNVYGQGLTDDVARNRNDNLGGQGTNIRLRDPTNNVFFAAGLGLGGTYINNTPPTKNADVSTNVNNSGDTGNPASTTFSAIKSVRVEGILQNAAGGDVGADSRAKSDPLGALFAVAVVPTGAPVRAFGSLSPDVGSQTQFDTIPEPAALGFIGLATVALTGRRRRA